MNKRDLKIQLAEMDIVNKKYISSGPMNMDDNKYSARNYVYEFEESDMTEKDVDTALLAKMASDISTIKKVCVFFAVVALLAIAASIFSAYQVSEIVKTITEVSPY